MVYCTKCGKQMHETALACPQCAAPAPVLAGNQNTSGSNSSASTSGLQYVIPIGRSGWAIAAGYLAFFAIFAFPGPLALLCGIMALLDIKKHPEKLGMPRAIFGIVMGALGTALLLVIFLRK